MESGGPVPGAEERVSQRPGQKILRDFVLVRSGSPGRGETQVHAHLGSEALSLGGDPSPSPPAPSTCLKSQVVDLKAEGYWEELMDTTRPDIEVKDW